MFPAIAKKYLPGLAGSEARSEQEEHVIIVKRDGIIIALITRRKDLKRFRDMSGVTFHKGTVLGCCPSYAKAEDHLK